MLNGNAQTVCGVEIIDDYTIKIINDETFVTFLDYLCLLPIYPETACREAGKKWGNEVIVGTGPFEVESFNIDYGCRVKKFKDYHKQIPKIDSIYFKFFDDLNTMMIDYEAKNVDFLILSDKVANQYINNEKYKSHVKSFDPYAVYFIVLNINKDPWNNKKVRQAFSYAVDINSICKDLTNNKISPAGCLSIPQANGYNPDMKVKEYNPEKSLQILKDAGIDIPVKVEMPVSTLENWSGQIIVALQDQAKRAGFEISTPIMDIASLNDLKHSGSRSIGIASWFFNFPNMDQVFYTFFHSTTSFNMSSCYQNKEYDIMIEKARKTFDTSELTEIYKKADEKIVSEDVIAIPIGYPKEHYMIQPWVKDFEIKNLKFPFEFYNIDLQLKNK